MVQGTNNTFLTKKLFRINPHKTNSMCLAITQDCTAHEQRKNSKHTIDWNKDLYVIIGINV